MFYGQTPPGFFVETTATLNNLYQRVSALLFSWASVASMKEREKESNKQMLTSICLCIQSCPPSSPPPVWKDGKGNSYLRNVKGWTQVQDWQGFPITATRIREGKIMLSKHLLVNIVISIITEGCFSEIWGKEEVWPLRGLPPGSYIASQAIL